MPEIRPFDGLVFDVARTGPLDAVAAPPYDTISPVDQDRFYRASPYNVIRLILGKEEPGDGPSSNKYTRAASDLQEWRAAGILRRVGEPAVYPYEFRYRFAGESRRLRGLIAEVGLEPLGGAIVPHERTMLGPIEDRLQLLRHVGANLSPIYGVVAGPSRRLEQFLEQAMAREPLRVATDEDGTEHQIWSSPGERDDAEAALHELQTQTLMIADGHHRYAVALEYQREMRASRGPGPWDAMMMLIVDGATEDPPVLPIHRLVSSQADPRPEDHPTRVRDVAEILASIDDEELTYGVIRMDGPDPLHAIARLTGEPPTVSVLHEQLLHDVPAAALRFTPDAGLAEHAVRSGEANTAYLLPPTRVERVRRVIARGRKLPQKSTYFWPKPRTGLVIRPLGD